MLNKHSVAAIMMITVIAAGSCRSAPGVFPPTTSQSNPQLPQAASTITLLSPSATATQSSTHPLASTPTATEVVFEVGKELTIDYLRDLEISGSPISIEEKLSPGSNYQRYLASYQSEGNTIYGLLTVPFGDPPPGGFKAIVFNHGYIPPTSYRTLERYVAYVDSLARNGFVVFKIDFRGHGNSEGYPSGSYFSPGYTIDAVSALKSLQTLDYVDPTGIGMWGHSMAGNLVLRAMLIEPQVKAGVIWAGAVYSYEDFSTYGISDNTYRPPPTLESQDAEDVPRRSRVLFDIYGPPDLEQPYWQAVSLTENLSYLNAPLQIHHAADDPVVDIAYSYGLAEQLQLQNKAYEFFIYEGGGHNIISPYFDQAMLRTIQFFQDNL
jgi:uncharacterized protein